MALFRGSKDSSSNPEGEASAECMKVGQVLVDGGHLSPEHLATALARGVGDAG